MTQALSHNTQAILLLTAPLIAGRGSESVDLLSPSEYKRLARHLREIQHRPADLVCADAADVLRACQPVIAESRLERLLQRGFLLSQVIERWQARAIWVISRADAEYPRRLKARLREDAPAVIYGCGDIALLETGGIGVVGSRHVSEALIDYTMAIGRLAARSGSTVVSGGAKGIDQAAMRGALEAGGTVCGVLADSLERTTMDRDHRNLLLDRKLVLISPYDPSASFNVGHAMQRNKLIYALSDAALVVSSDVNKGGTWAGAVEQLDKLRFVPVYVRSSGESTAGLDALRLKGALPWPNPRDVDTFKQVVMIPAPSAVTLPLAAHSLFDEVLSDVAMPKADLVSESLAGMQVEVEPSFPSNAAPNTNQTTVTHEDLLAATSSALAAEGNALEKARVDTTPGELLFASVRALLQVLLTVPMKETEVAVALDVSTAQAKAWLQRLVDEGILERQKRPAGYVIKQKRLFE